MELGMFPLVSQTTPSIHSTWCRGLVKERTPGKDRISRSLAGIWHKIWTNGAGWARLAALLFPRPLHPAGVA